MTEQPTESWAVGYHDRGHGHGDYGVVTKSGKLIAKVEGGPDAGDNARKLAAAPDLLAVCKTAREQLRFYDERLTIKNHDKELLIELDAAITKAEKAE